MSTSDRAGDNPLVGTWHLVRWEISYGDGRAPTLPFGADASGMITYGSDGTMQAWIGRAQRPRLSSESVRSAPVAQRLAAFESYFQYAGRYTLRGEPGAQQVTHSVTHSLNPNFVGTQQVRDMRFGDDGRLTLSASDRVPASNTTRLHSLVWERKLP